VDVEMDGLPDVLWIVDLTINQHDQQSEWTWISYLYG
jgi:hypothetical protein